MGIDYKGQLYGYVGGEYIPLEMTSEDVDQLAEENQRLREDAAQVFIEEAHLENGNFEARMNTKVGAGIAAFIKETMESQGAENFLTTTVSFSDGTECYYLTFGRAYGESMHEKYQEVCAERDALKSELKEERNEARKRERE